MSILWKYIMFARYREDENDTYIDNDWKHNVCQRRLQHTCYLIIDLN